MSTPSVLIATAKVRPGSEDAFTQWKAEHDAVMAKAPGYISSDIMPPDDHNDMWTILMNFDSDEAMSAWQKSPERAAIVGKLLPLVSGGDIGQAMKRDMPNVATPGTNVTQVIFSEIKPGKEDAYREWAARMQQEQSKYPGYKGMYLQPPGPGGTHWTTLLRFDTTQNLEKWLAAPERARMLKESQQYIVKEELMRLATSFPGWVPIKSDSGKQPPGWKAALLVLLGLYPIVMLEMVFLKLPFTFAVNMFFGNVISVALTSFVTIPGFIWLFKKWLFADENSKEENVKGNLILLGLFIAEVLFFWWFWAATGHKG